MHQPNELRARMNIKGLETGRAFEKLHSRTRGLAGVGQRSKGELVKKRWSAAACVPTRGHNHNAWAVAGY